MDIQKTIAVVVFTFTSFLLWDAWQKQHLPVPAPSGTAATAVPQPSQPLSTGPRPAAAPAAVQSSTLGRGERIVVRTDQFLAEIDTAGGDIRQLELSKHFAADSHSKKFVLMQDGATPRYVTQSGLLGDGLPDHNTRYTAASKEYALGEGKDSLQVRLETQTPDGVKVAKVYTFHRGSYVIDLGFELANGGAKAIHPHAYYQFLRDSAPPEGDPKFISTFTGPALYNEKDKFVKINFADIDKGKEGYTKKTNDGWISMLQHYFVAAWLPKAGIEREFYTRKVGELYTAGVILPSSAVEPGQVGNIQMQLYAGPQEVDKLSKLAPGLDLTVDYGMLTIIAAPIFKVLSWMYQWVGNWGVAIVLLTVLIKLAFFPLSAASYKSMAKMRVVTPKLQRLKEQYGNDRQKLHQAMMELYKSEKINPLGGCLPVVVQIPVFIALYWVLLASVDLRHAPLIGWIQDLSAPDPYYVLPIIMGITMLVQTKLNPTPPDPIQAKVMMIMPFAFSIFFFFFPAGLVLYWIVNNLLSIAQQWQITRTIERTAQSTKGHGRA